MESTNKSEVVVVYCDSYDKAKVEAALRAGIERLGGLEKFVLKDEKILVKPNLLKPSTPDKVTVTDPSVLSGVLKLLNEKGYTKVSYGDSPGMGTMSAAIRDMGFTSADEYGAAKANMSEEVTVNFPEGDTCKTFHLCKEVTEASALINVCKMKTHALERITGAVKNLYGLICGVRKAAGHVLYPNATVFARALVDLHKCVKPRLHIMDGIMAMEGNGPSGGTPIAMNCLLFSADPVALDTVFCYLVNLDPLLVPTNSQGEVMGLGHCSEDKISITLIKDGEESKLSRDELVSLLGKESFDVDREKPRGSFLLGFSNMMTKLSKRPFIDKSKCIKCGVCVEHCPVPGKAVNFKGDKNSPPVYDYGKCIRCYCCQEMCPAHAIKVKGKA